MSLVEAKLVGDKSFVAKVKQWPAIFQTRLERLVGAYGLKLQTKVKFEKLAGQVLKRRSGNLQKSIYLKVEKKPGSVIATVGSRLPYARIQEKGGVTRPHIIRAKNGQALHFMWQGRGVFFRSVNHPGSVIPARSYLESAKKELMPSFLRDLKLIAKRGSMKGDPS